MGGGGGFRLELSWAGTVKTFIVVVVQRLQQRTSAAGPPSTSGDRGATDRRTDGRLSKFLHSPVDPSVSPEKPRETRPPPSVVSTSAPVSWGT